MSENTHDRLAGYFEEIYESLTARGVPEDRLPSPWAILSHVLESVDYGDLGEWIENYAALEAVEDPEDPESDSESESDTQDPQAPGTPRRRPAYLRALGSLAPDADAPVPESETRDTDTDAVP